MKLYTNNGVELYRSELIPCPHGFATRIGGVSTEAHTRSLNLAFGRGDDDATVRENLSRFLGAIGLDCRSVISLPQVHGTDVLTVTARDAGDGYFYSSGRTADGYVTVDRGVTLGVKTADCVPILLCGLRADGTPIAVSALHAGWRGTAGGIAKRGVETLLRLGVERENIRAAIGPSIRACCYEVGTELRDVFLKTLGESIAAEAFTERRDGKQMLDLRSVNRALLLSCGIPYESIDVSEECTSCSPERFFSHRYSRGLRGTMLSVIALPSGGQESLLN